MAQRLQEIEEARLKAEEASSSESRRHKREVKQLKNKLAGLRGYVEFCEAARERAESRETELERELEVMREKLSASRSSIRTKTARA